MPRTVRFRSSRTTANRCSPAVSPALWSTAHVRAVWRRRPALWRPHRWLTSTKTPTAMMSTTITEVRRWRPLRPNCPIPISRRRLLRGPKRLNPSTRSRFHRVISSTTTAQPEVELIRTLLQVNRHCTCRLPPPPLPPPLPFPLTLLTPVLFRTLPSLLTVRCLLYQPLAFSLPPPLAPGPPSRTMLTLTTTTDSRPSRLH